MTETFEQSQKDEIFHKQLTTRAWRDGQIAVIGCIAIKPVQIDKYILTHGTN